MATVFVSIGSNVDRHRNIVSCLQALRNQFGELQVSSVYENEAVGFAGDNCSRTVEACPIEPARPLIWGEAFVGIASVFRQAGFDEVARRSPTRPLMRIMV